MLFNIIFIDLFTLPFNVPALVQTNLKDGHWAWCHCTRSRMEIILRMTWYIIAIIPSNISTISVNGISSCWLWAIYLTDANSQVYFIVFQGTKSQWAIVIGIQGVVVCFISVKKDNLTHKISKWLGNPMLWSVTNRLRNLEWTTKSWK